MGSIFDWFLVFMNHDAAKVIGFTLFCFFIFMLIAIWSGN